MNYKQFNLLNNSNRVVLRLLGLAFVLVTLTACETTNAGATDESQPVIAVQPHNKIDMHTSLLAAQLFHTFRYANLPKEQYRFAVATFVPVEMMQTDSEHQGPLRLLGHQLEQGMMTELARRGYIAQDYKATNNLIIEEKSDRVFSRNVDDLYKNHRDVDFYLSGTLTEAEQGVIANARIIHVDSKDVVAAASRFIPDDVFWQAEKITTRGGRIYRSEGE
ncbi:FlgO family outer membrane protein [Planctobacterium marinum]|uniref:FlgO family outer membrane protein n=1 Tax=Planctobacterium marinum TaxID=1631968 RepID=UPI001E5DDFA2|nr:FlgO family outer membrane protein [Planctobacterium marinum]MCC2605898.1 hypothetical protein [Planctobacterium marinum]